MIKKSIMIIAILSALVLLIMCQVIYSRAEIPNGQIPSAKNVSMDIKKNTLTKTSATIIITDNNAYRFKYKEWFRIDKKESGEWREVDFISEPSFSSEYYETKRNGKIKFKINWSEIYGELETGEYRIVKSVRPEEYIYAEFSIE